MMPSKNPVIQRVMEEQYQAQATRKQLFLQVEQELGRPVVTYFTSFRFPVMVDDSDADMLEGILQKLDLSNGLALMVSSPGGLGLAAERIINVCRNYSDTNEFWAIVPGKAKSAATMICFGASKILMGVSSELGPIDPQLTITDESGLEKRYSLWSIVKSYQSLFANAIKAKGNLQPYLQQLANYDARDIKEYQTAIELSEDIAIRSLKSGMMAGQSIKAIKSKIKIFLSPETTKAHGRPVYRREAEECGLSVDKVNSKEKLGQLIYELYIRTNNLCNTRVTKCVESKDHEFVAQVVGRG